MRILYVVQAMFEHGHQHIVDFLRQRGCKVEVVTIKHDGHMYNGIGKYKTTMRYGDFCGQAMVQKCNQIKYDVIIFTIHSTGFKGAGSTPTNAIGRFQTKVSPRLGYVDIEHDLLFSNPCHSMLQKSLGIVSFHGPHVQFLEKLGYQTHMAQWYKLGEQLPPHGMANVDPLQDAVFVGTNSPGWMIHLNKHQQLPYGKLFRNVWYKRFTPKDDQLKAGTKRLPPPFDGPTGVAQCAKIAKFFFVRSSSCLLEAMLYGSIPILYNVGEQPTEQVTEVVSRVKIPRDVRYPCEQMLAVTPTDLDKKVKLLRKQPDVYQETLALLKQDWFPEDYQALPTTHETVWKIIRGAKS